ncbi:hypothetical protein DICVIV_04070 [Dictyocaulus viviparus]|uniref:Uncharacterized protein n=1 Tax=Dictyocaulus viviparus TaxID=29172 RepID=A0A0D8Y0Z9_DICVI|nr:hypothetical protein DICVIV_04070 [Dictyocaulus viviparus]
MKSTPEKIYSEKNRTNVCYECGDDIKHCELRHNLHRYKLIKYSGSNTVGMLNELEMELEKRGIPHDILQDIRSQELVTDVAMSLWMRSDEFAIVNKDQ